MEQLHDFYGVPLPMQLAGDAAARSLGSLLAEGMASGGLRIGDLHIQAGADPEHITVSCLPPNRAPLLRPAAVDTTSGSEATGSPFRRQHGRK